MTVNDHFALIGHPPSINLLHKYLEFFKTDYQDKRMDDKLLRTMYEWMPPFKAFDISTQHPYTSEDVKGTFVLSTFFPEMMVKSWKKAVNKVKDAIRLSESSGAKVVALGGFASIVDGHQGLMVAKAAKSIAVTNGSTMTTALTIEGIEKICAILKIDLSIATVAIIGATGSIGRTCAQYFMGQAGRIILTGKKQVKLEKYFPQCGTSGDGQIELTTNNHYAAAAADIVICVTSSVHSLFSADAFRSGAVVCDVGFPKTVSEDCADRPDIIVYMGGLAQMPWTIDQASVWGLNSKQIVYGCFAEAMTIAMEGSYEYCTVGLEDIHLDKVKTMIDIAHKHGFQVAPFANSKRRYTEKDFQEIRRILEDNNLTRMAV